MDRADKQFVTDILPGIATNHLVAMVVVLVACVFDLRYRRIPNLLTFGAALAAFGFTASTHGAAGLITSVSGWLVGCALFLPFFLLGGMGAGDVKLLAGVCAWLTPAEAMWTALYTMIAGGVMAVLVALVSGYLRKAFANVSALLTHWRIGGIRPLPELTLAKSRGPRLPYALPIAAGTMAAIWFR